MKILILGGTAFIGYYVVRQLISSDEHTVTLFNRGNRPADVPEGMNVIHGDRNEIANYADALRAVQPDVVLDMAPLSDVDAAKVTAVFRGHTARIVMISSCDVYRAYDILSRNSDAPPDETPLKESAPLREKMYPYAHREGVSDRLKSYDKILAEREYQSYEDMPGTVLRLPMVYGMRDYQHRLLRYIVQMDTGRPAILLHKDFASWRSTRGYVEDVAHAISLAVTDSRAAGRIYNVGEEYGATEAEWVTKIAKYVGWNGKVISVPEEFQHEGVGMNCMQDLTIDTTAIRHELGFTEIISEEEAYRRTIEFERSVPADKLPADFTDFSADDKVLAAMNQS